MRSFRFHRAAGQPSKAQICQLQMTSFSSLFNPPEYSHILLPRQTELKDMIQTNVYKAFHDNELVPAVQIFLRAQQEQGFAAMKYVLHVSSQKSGAHSLAFCILFQLIALLPEQLRINIHF